MFKRILPSLALTVSLVSCGASDSSSGFLGTELNSRTTQDSTSTEASEVISAYGEVLAADAGLGLTAGATASQIKDCQKFLRKHLRIAQLLTSTDQASIYTAANTAIVPACKQAGLDISAGLQAKLGLVACSKMPCSDEEFTAALEANFQSAEIAVDQKDAFMTKFTAELMAGAPDQHATAVAKAISQVAKTLGVAPDNALADMAKYARSAEFLTQAMAGTGAVMADLGFSEKQIAAVFSAVQESETFKNATDQNTLLNTIRQTVASESGNPAIAEIFSGVAGAISSAVADAVAAVATAAPTAAPVINYANSILSLTVGVAMTAVDPANGTFTGAAGKSCAISPELPAGLSLNTSTCVISGTPTAAIAQTTYTITITDTNGSGTDQIAIAVARPPFSTALDLTSAAGFTCDGVGSCATHTDNITFASGTASLPALDLKTNTAAEWTATGTTLAGVTNSSDTLTLNSTTNSAWSLDSSWTPQYDSLIIHYDFEGSSGDAVNRVNPGTYNGSFVAGAARTNTDAAVGSKSMTLDGTGNFLNTSYVWDTSPNTSGTTLMMWLKFDSSNSSYQQLFHSSGNSQSMAVRFDAGTKVHMFYTTPSAANMVGNSDDQMSADTWHHVVLTLSSSGYGRLYVDGRDKGGGRSADGYPSWDTTAALTIGAQLGGGDPLDAEVDEVAVWTKELTASEIAKIYEKQKVSFSGTYTSKVFDIGADTALTTLALDTPLPFGKSLPATAESATTYSDIQNSGGSSTLQSGLLAYFNFDGDVADGLPDVSNNSHDGSVSGTLYSGQPGVIGNSWRFGSGHTNHGDLTVGGAISVSAWILRDNVINAHASLVGEGDDGEWDVHFENATDDIRLSLDPGTGWTYNNTNLPAIAKLKWNHIVVVRDNSFSGDDYKIYIDGVEALTNSWLDGSSIIDDAGSHDLHIGGWSNGTRRYSGLIDEVGIWNRGLTAAEALELYRRGANRISVMARTCPDATCSTDPSWLGSGGYQSGISEWQNNSTLTAGNPTGSTNITGPFFLFSNFVSQPTAQRYWQYRVIMESLDDGNACSGSSRCNPVLNSFSFHERVGDAIGGTEVTRYGTGSFVNSTPISFTSLTSLAFTSSGTCKHQVSPNGGTTFYFNSGGTWTPASSDTQANASNDTAWSDLSGLPAGSGNLVIKTIMGGAGAACSVSGIQVNGFN